MHKATYQEKPGYFPPGADEFALRSFYDLNGYVVINGAFTTKETEVLITEATALCRGDRGEIGTSPGSFTDFKGAEWKRADPHDPDDIVLQRILAIHMPHKLSAMMRDTLTHASTLDALTTIVGPNLKSMQSMLFLKGPGKPGQAWHQDETFIPTRDRSLTAAWIALDRTTIDNGCLWVIPGSHKAGILWEMREHHDPRFDHSAEARGFPYTDEDAIPVELEAGSVLLFNGYLLHRSLPNITTGFRRALVNHYMSCESLLAWKASPDYRDVTIVAGIDPYAWKGLEDLSKPYIRPL